jgi:CubicO group peptidase (beta-lactamase class C family)/membrane protease YdiL (CAAX protease family)
MAAPNRPSAERRRGWFGGHWRPVLVGALVAAVIVGIASAVRMGSVTPPVPATAADGGPDFAAIDRYVEDEMDAQRIPGLALAIVHGNRVAHLRGFGDADDSGRQVTAQTLFFNGSTTKSFTALAIMQLREAGKLELDAPVQRYLPWWRVADPNASARITIRDLLYQVSGLSKATGNEHATSSAAESSALEDQVRELRSAKLTEPVGATWQYSNANYNTLGMVVQAVSGQPYETYVREHILVPLDMRNSVMSVPEAKARGLVTGHRYWFGRPFAAELPFNRGNLPAGGLISSVEDMSHYLSALLNEGRYGSKAIVSPAGMAELQRAGVPTGHGDVSYAMGWDVRETNGIPVLSHDGSMFNAHANIVLVPDGKWGIVLLENAENSPDELFGARRMSGIADGVTSLLKGKQPEAAGSSITLPAVYAVILAFLALQIAAIARSARKLRRGRVEQRPHGVVRVLLSLAFTLALSLLWALVVLVLLPSKVQAPVSALLMGLPDLGYLLVGSVALGLAWSVSRIVWAGVNLRPAPAFAAAAPVVVPAEAAVSNRARADAEPRRAGLIRRHPLASFFVLTFAIAWIVWLPLVIAGGTPTGFLVVPQLLGSLVPSAVAIVLIAMLHGKAGVGKLLRRLLIWRVGVGWWVAVVLLSALPVCALALNVLLGGDAPDVADTIPAIAFLFLFSIFPGSAGGEELGWRGFALPQLQAVRSALGASIVLGVVWGVWHLPLYLLGTELRPLSLFPVWIVLTVALSVILTWIYNGTGGSLLMIVLLHAGINLPLTVGFEPVQDDLVQPFLICAALITVAAAVVAVAAGARNLSRKRAKQVVVP